MIERQINIGGLSVNYKVFGEGKPVLVLHGWGRGSDSWAKVSELLERQGCRVVCPDLPGFGKSQEPGEPWDVEKYLAFVDCFTKQLGLESFFLIGHSFGGGLALAFSSLHPQRVKMLVLCDAAIIRKERLGLRQRIAKKLSLGRSLILGIPLIGRPMHSLSQKILYRFAGAQDYFRASGAMRKTFAKVVSQDLSRFAAGIKVPVLIIWGQKDQSTPLEDAYTLQHLIPGSAADVINGIGHNPQRDVPDVLAKKIVNFIKNQ